MNNNMDVRLTTSTRVYDKQQNVIRSILTKGQFPLYLQLILFLFMSFLCITSFIFSSNCINCYKADFIFNKFIHKDTPDIIIIDIYSKVLMFAALFTGIIICIYKNIQFYILKKYVPIKNNNLPFAVPRQEYLGYTYDNLNENNNNNVCIYKKYIKDILLIISYICVLILSILSSICLGILVEFFNSPEYSIKRSIRTYAITICICGFIFTDTICIIFKLTKLSDNLEFLYKDDPDSKICQLCLMGLKCGDVTIQPITKNEECVNHTYHVKCFLSLHNELQCPGCGDNLLFSFRDTFNSFFTWYYFSIVYVTSGIVKLFGKIVKR